MPLALEDVLVSVDRSYPLLLAALLEQERARAAVLEAEGAFDTRLRAEGGAAPTGYYDRYSADLGIEQPTRLWGSRLFAGYRLGRGDYPSYLGGEKTNRDGEFRAGVEVPLLKDGATDARRTRLRTSEIEQRSAEPEIEIRRITIVREATEAFWNWVAMGLNVEVERDLLATAQARGEQLEGRVERGAIPRIQLIDNQRLIVDREIRLRSAERDARDAAIELSLFLRDESGRTLIPSPERLPHDFPTEHVWDEEQLQRDIARASESHPILRELRLRQEQLEARLALDRNALLPDLRVRLEGSQDFGKSSAGIDSKGSFSSNPKDDTELKALVRFEIPVLQRGARGRVARTRAESARLAYETRFARDRIEAEIRQAMAALRAAFDQTTLARRNLELANQLKQAEERKLALGSSNLIDVNIRELQAADAARALIFAQAAFFRSLARYQAGVAAPPEPSPQAISPALPAVGIKRASRSDEATE
jgi:outer membrane protein TolC